MLRVSRDDISTDHIEEFSPEERFLKIPVENYLELKGIEANGPQMALINAINNPKYRFITGCFSRRTGKTLISNIIGQLVALTPGTTMLLIAPNYSLTMISWDLQIKMLREFGVEIVKNNAKDKIIELGNGSMILMGSASQANSVVGRSYDLILFDEAALIEKGDEVFNVQLRPCLDKLNSKAIFISTPRGASNYFHDFFQRGFSDEFPAWATIHADYEANPRAVRSDIQEAKNAMSFAEFAQEYLADFTVMQGRVWNFSSECIKDLSDLDISEMDIIAGIDFGFRDPTAIVVLAFDDKTDTVYALADYQDNEQTTDKHAEEFLRLEHKYGIDMAFADHSAAQTRWDWSINYDISTLAAKKSKLDGIAAVSRLVDHDKLIVDSNCTHLLFTLATYRWHENSMLEKERTVHDDSSHMADALRYAVYSYEMAMSIS